MGGASTLDGIEGWGFTTPAHVLFAAYFVAMFVGVPLFLILRGRKAKRNHDALFAAATARGFGYIAEDGARAGYFTGYPFETGASRRARNVIWGTIAGRSFETFAYTYGSRVVVSDADNDAYMAARGLALNAPELSEHRFQITWVPLPGRLPVVRLLTDVVSWRDGGLAEGTDLKVESAEFNRAWRVECDDPRIGHALLTPRMILRLLEPDVQGMDFTFEGAALWTPVPRLSDLSDLDTVVEQLSAIAGLIPPFLFDAAWSRPFEADP